MVKSDPNPLRNDIQKWDVELPAREFLYTCDQIAYMIDVDEAVLRQTYLYYTGRELTGRRLDKIKAVNISPSDEVPEWRVTHTDFCAWMRYKGITFEQIPNPTRGARRR